MSQFRSDEIIFEEPAEISSNSGGIMHTEEEGLYDDSMCNLIINYLPHDIDDLILKNIFSEHGEITMAKVVRDKHTKKSLGYGFVKFLNKESASEAIQKKNGYNIGHKVIKVSLARPASEEIRNCKLYVTNLPKEYTELDVVDLFKQFGDIIECRVLKDPNTRLNRGVAFVQFDLRIQAQNGLSLNGYRPHGSDRNLVVKYAEDQQKRKQERRMLGTDGRPDLLGGDVMSTLRGAGISPNYPYAYPAVQSRLPTNVSSHIQLQMLNSMQWGIPPVAAQPSNGVLYTPLNHQPHNFPGRGKGAVRPGTNFAHYQPQIGPDATAVPWLNAVIPNSQASDHSMGIMDGRIGSNEYSIPPRANIAAANGLNAGRFAPPNQKLVYSTPASSVTLTIANLPEDADLALLHDLLAPYGQVLGAHVDIVDGSTVIGEDGTPSARTSVCSGRGRVQIAGITAATYAIQSLNGVMIFEGCPPLQVSITVDEANSGSRNSNGRSMQAAPRGVAPKPYFGQLSYTLPQPGLPQTTTQQPPPPLMQYQMHPAAPQEFQQFPQQLLDDGTANLYSIAPSNHSGAALYGSSSNGAGVMNSNYRVSSSSSYDKQQQQQQQRRR